MCTTLNVTGGEAKERQHLNVRNFFILTPAAFTSPAPLRSFVCCEGIKLNRKKLFHSSNSFSLFHHLQADTPRIKGE
jgi:hypothetical protein